MVYTPIILFCIQWPGLSCSKFPVGKSLKTKEVPCMCNTFVKKPLQMVHDWGNGVLHITLQLNYGAILALCFRLKQNA